MADEIDIRVQDIKPSILRQLVRCISCNLPMIFIYHASVRDTCDECGGKAKK